METGMRVIAVFLAAGMCVLLIMILRGVSPENHLSQIRGEIAGRDYGSVAERLQRSGLAGKMTPACYRLMQCFIFLAVFLLLLGNNQPFAVSTGIAGVTMFLPELFLRARIRSENKRMLSDIEHIYNLLHLQEQAGAFLLDSLIDCYRVVAHERLKMALIRLTADINAKKPIGEATEEFAAKFDNPHLSTLADIIRYGVEDGSTGGMIADVAEQIQAIQQARYIAEEGKQEAESLIIMTLLFLGILVTVLYMGAGALGGSNHLL